MGSRCGARLTRENTLTMVDVGWVRHGAPMVSHIVIMA
jgi:hypothetical protein